MLQMTVGLPVAKSATRVADYAECLEKNIGNPWLTSLIAIQEEPLPAEDPRNQMLLSPKIRLIQLGRRATFSDHLDALRETPFAGLRGLMNSDVHFDFTLMRLRGLSLGKAVLGFTRTDLLMKEFYGHDAWVFSEVPHVAANFCLGYDQCDWIFEELLIRLGYEVLDPSYTVRCVHVHTQRIKRGPTECVGERTRCPEKKPLCEIDRGRLKRW